MLLRVEKIRMQDQRGCNWKPIVEIFKLLKVLFKETLHQRLLRSILLQKKLQQPFKSSK